MVPTETQIEVWKTYLKYWEWFGYVSTAIVGIGCVGEYLAEFTRIKNYETLKHKVERISLVILIAGIGCEILTAYKISDWSAQIIGGIEAHVGEAEQRAAEANLKAAQANERASQNEKEAEKLRKQAQPRTIREADRQNLGEELKKFAPSLKGRQVAIQSQVGDAEGVLWATEIMDVLQRAGIDVDASGIAALQVVHATAMGTLMTAPPQDQQFVSALVNGLNKKLDPVLGTSVYGEWKPEYTKVTILVGVKLIPGIPKQFLRKHL